MINSESLLISFYGQTDLVKSVSKKSKLNYLYLWKMELWNTDNVYKLEESDHWATNYIKRPSDILGIARRVSG